MARIVLGVTGSIAAFKACDVASKLTQGGHEVDVLMTRGALRFVRPLSFAALTRRGVTTDRSWGRGPLPHDHLEAVAGADLLLVAPATANAIGKFAHGIADGVLYASWLAARCPRLLAPAMNGRMWLHPRVQANVALLQEEDVRFVGPERGWLSEGEVDVGRMSEPARILEVVGELLAGPGA